LSEVIDTIENYVMSQELKPVGYNIEIKSDPKNYGSFQPYPEEFVDLVMQVIKGGNIEEKVVMQSFDPEPLHILRENYPKIPVSFLVENGSINENLGKLNFLPEIYSPHFSLLKDSTTVSAIKTKGLQVIPWTVNERQDIQRMIDLKVDAIISDYPEKVISLLKKQQQ
jgi:glycerophosphoryl diester phosphodiesterase